MSFGSIQLYYFTLGQLLFVTGVDEIWPSLLYSIGISSQATFQDEAEAIKIFMFHAIHRFCWMFAPFGISKKQVSLQMVLVFVDKLKLLGFVLFLVVVSSIFYCHTKNWGNSLQFDLRIFFKWVGSTTNSDKVLKVDPFDPLESSWK